MVSMTTTKVRDYLDALERALRELPRERRHEIVEDIRSHIDSALADLPTDSGTSVETVLDNLGTPQEIAAAALAEMPPVPTRFATRDVITIIALLIGGIVLPVVGWFIGAVLLWTSTAWRVKDKLIATLLVPGGLLVPVLLLTVASTTTSATTCTGPAQPLSPSAAALGGSTHVVAMACGGGTSTASIVLRMVLLVFAVGAPLLSAFWLVRHARRVG